MENDLFDVDTPQRAPQAGDLLVVEPFLREVHFRRSVVLLIDHSDKDGTVGIILNHRSNIKLCEVLRNATCPPHIPLHIGGPVEHGRLLYIHTLSDRLRESTPLENGLFIGGNFDDVLEYINSEEYDASRIKFFAGYSGWTAGQLAAEIAEKTWAVTSLDNTATAMASHNSDYWYEIVATLDKQFRPWLLCPAESYLN